MDINKTPMARFKEDGLTYQLNNVDKKKTYFQKNTAPYTTVKLLTYLKIN